MYVFITNDWMKLSLHWIRCMFLYGEQLILQKDLLGSAMTYADLPSTYAAFLRVVMLLCSFSHFSSGQWLKQDREGILPLLLRGEEQS